LIKIEQSSSIGGIAQLAVFIHAYNMEFNMFAELLEMAPLY